MRRRRLNELVRVGAAGLQGEVLRVAGDIATLQVFEDTGGLALGEPVHRTGGPLLRRARARPARHRVRRHRPPAGAAGGGHAATSWPPASTCRRSIGRAGTNSSPRSPRAPRSGRATCSARSTSVDSCTGSWCRPGGAGGCAPFAPGAWRVDEAVGGVRRRHAAHAAAALAGAPAAPGGGTPAVRPAVHHRAADLRLPVPGGRRRRGRRARRLRHRQDGHRAVAGQVRRRRRRRLRRLRRARQRDGRRAGRFRQARRSAPRHAGARSHGARRQHVEHAGRRARGVGLSRADHRRVLPRHGLPRRGDGRFAVALGRGAARDRLAPAADAGRGRLPHLPGQPGRPACTSARGGCAAPASPSATARSR